MGPRSRVPLAQHSAARTLKRSREHRQTIGPLRSGRARRVPSPTVIIRDATDADWRMIYPFFSEIIAAGRTFAYPEGMSSDQARAYWMVSAPDRTVVATEAGTILGSANMGPNRPGRGSHVATANFMVDPAHQGKGVGRALGTHVLDWARQNGYHSIQFNAVVETNTAAVHLWQSLGFEVLATVPEAFDHPDHGLVGLHVMYQRLTGDHT